MPDEGPRTYPHAGLTMSIPGAAIRVVLSPELLTYPPPNMSGSPGQAPWAETA